MRKAAFHNLGCKVNATELGAVERQFAEAGFEIVPFGEPADVCVVNTCTVTAVADKKSRQMLHRARRANPDAVVAAVGCYVETAGEEALKESGIDLAVGNDRKHELLELVTELLEKKQEERGITRRVRDMRLPGAFEELGPQRLSERCRAFVRIEDGCSQFCSYCAIPYARGRVRSREPGKIEEEIRGLAAEGVKEVVLTGIHISSYGTDRVPPERRRPGQAFYGEPGLGDIVELAASVPGIERVRLGSLEPRILTEEFVQQIAGVEKLCPQFHLSLQSGCSETLKRMNRHYTAEEFLAGCARLREAFGDPALTADLITGFPGETEEEFAQTMRFLRQVGFSRLHVFPFSLREGTAAERLPNHVSRKDKTVRAALAASLGAETAHAYEERHLGREAELLTEETVVLDGKEFTVGYTREYLRAGIPGTVPPNTLVRGILRREPREGETSLVLLGGE